MSPMPVTALMPCGHLCVYKECCLPTCTEQCKDPSAFLAFRATHTYISENDKQHEDAFGKNFKYPSSFTLSCVKPPPFSFPAERDESKFDFVLQLVLIKFIIDTVFICRIAA